MCIPPGIHRPQRLHSDWDPCCDKVRQQALSLLLRAHEHGDRRERLAAEHTRTDLRGDPGPFLGRVPKAAEQHARCVRGRQTSKGRLGHEAVRVLQEWERRGEHVRRASIRLRHPDHLRAWPVVRKAKHVVARRTSPSINGLIVVRRGEDG